MFNRFKKGKRIYTRWDKNTEQVTILSRNQSPQLHGEIKVEIPEPEAEGFPSNVFAVRHTNEEFILDFGSVAQAGNRVRIGRRVIMAPSAAKGLMLKLKKVLNA